MSSIFYFGKSITSFGTSDKAIQIPVTGLKGSTLPEPVEIDNLSWKIEKDRDSKPQPICGNRAVVTGLLVGIDYRGDNFESGLADVVRVVSVDFTIPSINLIALPRDLLVTLPDGQFTISGPAKLSQAYLFGTSGFNPGNRISGGPGALEQVIDHNFAVSADHYLVLDFRAFESFIDAIGGIEVDLPQAINDQPNAFFAAGKHLLNGEQALILARARKQYGEPFRIENQTLIMQSVFNRVMEPSVLLKLPGLLADFREEVLTDLSSEQIALGLCLLQNLKSENLHFNNPGGDLLKSGSEYLPTLNGYSFVWRWDTEFVDWIHRQLSETNSPLQ